MHTRTSPTDPSVAPLALPPKKGYAAGSTEKVNCESAAQNFLLFLHKSWFVQIRRHLKVGLGFGGSVTLGAAAFIFLFNGHSGAVPVAAPRTAAKEYVSPSDTSAPQLFVRPDGKVSRYPTDTKVPLEEMRGLSRSSIYGTRLVADLLEDYVDLTGDGQNDLYLSYFSAEYRNGPDVKITEIIDGATQTVLLRDENGDYYVRDGRLHKVILVRRDELDLCNRMDVLYEYRDAQLVPRQGKCLTPPVRTVFLEDKHFVTDRPTDTPLDRLPEVHRNTDRGTEHVSQLLVYYVDLTRDGLPDLGLRYRPPANLGKRSTTVFELVNGATLDTLFLDDGQLDDRHYEFILDGRLHNVVRIPYNPRANDGCWIVDTTYEWMDFPLAESPNGKFVPVGEKCAQPVPN